MNYDNETKKFIINLMLCLSEAGFKDRASEQSKHFLDIGENFSEEEKQILNKIIKEGEGYE